MTLKSIRWVFILTCLIASTALKLHEIGGQSVWFDEGYSWNAAVQPTLIDSANADATNPPLYYILLHLAARVWGESEFALRLFSLILSMPLIPIAYQLGKSLSLERHRETGGLFAAALTAFLPLLWWASQEARMYTLMALFVTSAALAWHRLITRPSRGAWIVLLACELGLLYSHNSAPVIVLWLNVITLVVWVSRRSIRVPDWRVWGIGQGIVVGLWLPYFVTRFLDLGSANSAITSAPQINGWFLYDVWTSFWFVPYERVIAGYENRGISLVILITLLISFGGLTLLVRQARWMLLHVIVLTAGLIAALIVLGNEFHGRYVVMIAPLMAVGFGVALAHGKRLGGVIAAIIVGFSVISIITAFDPESRFRHDDARGMVQYYADTLTESDSVIAWSYADRYELAYYWDRLGVTADRITLPEGADMAEIVPMLPTSGDIALNVWYTQRADYRGMMGCLLEDGTTAEPESFTTYGMTNYTYRAPSLRAFELTPLDIPFGDELGEAARLTHIGALPQDYTADQALCVPLMITLSRPFDGELKARISVIHPIAGEIASVNPIIASADGRTSESAEPGELLMAFPRVRLPVGAPPGAYQIMVRLYDLDRRFSGYLPQTGTVSGRDLVVGTWNVQPGANWQVGNPNWDRLDPEWVSVTDSLRMGMLTDFSPDPQNGTTHVLTLVWEGEGELTAITAAAVDGAWSITLPPEQTDRLNGGYLLDWRRLTIPADAPTGEAEIRLPDGQVIARFVVESQSYLTDVPAFNISLDARIPTYAELLGAAADPVFSLTELPEITLLWRALGATPPDQAGATVFVQMLNRDGVVIAQSDMQPVTGSRPTTGWRDGEIIVDSHTLEWNALASAGEVTVIAGWYSAQTGERYPWADGNDYAVIGQFEVR